MDTLPSPKREQTGHLVDRYLAFRRQSGWSNRQIQREAQYLGEAAADHWKPIDDASQRAIQRFVRWLEPIRARSMTEHR